MGLAAQYQKPLNEYQLVYGIVMNFTEKNWFKESALEKEIRKHNLPMRVGPAETVHQCLQGLTYEDEYLKHNPSTGTYRRRKESEKSDIKRFPSFIALLPPIPE